MIAKAEVDPSQELRTRSPVRSAAGAPARVAIYSHDTYGLGHLRRNLLLAGALERWGPAAEVLLVTGSPRALFFEAPARTRVLKLPAVTKDEAGRYEPRAVDTTLENVVRARKGFIRDAVLEFAPDLLVVDHAPIGLRGELLPLLADLHHRSRTQLALGLRDILDDPRWVLEEWRRNGIHDVLASLYDHLWVYGDRKVFPLEDLYQLPRALAERLCYLGYLGRDTSQNGSASASLGFPDRSRPHLLCLLGGGGDGYPLAESFLRMLGAPGTSWNGTLVTGPFLSRERRQRLADLAGERPHVQVLRFTANIEPLIAGTDLVITMGGYNSVLETLSYGKRAVVVPRVFPRREQWLRATAFARHGLLEVIEPRDLAPERIADVSRRLLDAPPPPSPEQVGLAWDGAHNFAERVAAVLDSTVQRGAGSLDARPRPLSA